MWTCNKCGRIFQKTKQPHSCKTLPLEKHFENKEKAKAIFDYLFEEVNLKVGQCKIISLPCCIHLFGHYDFLAALPKKDGLEIRFSLDSKLNDPKIFTSVALSKKDYKNCLNLYSEKDIDKKLIDWLNKSYHLKDK